MKTRREVLKSAAAVAAVAVVPTAAVAEVLFGGQAGGGMSDVGIDLALEGSERTVVALTQGPRFHRFVAEFFIEGDIEQGRVLHRIISAWVEDRDHPEFPSRVGINLSKVEPA